MGLARILLVLIPVALFSSCVSPNDDDSADDDDSSVDDDDAIDCIVVGGDVDATGDVPVPETINHNGWLAVMDPELVSPDGLPTGEPELSSIFFVTPDGYPVAYSVSCLDPGDYVFVAVSDSDLDGEFCTEDDFFGSASVTVASDASPQIGPTLLLSERIAGLACD